MKDRFDLISLNDAKCYVKKQMNKDFKNIDSKYLKKVINRIEEMMIDVSTNYIIENDTLHPDTYKIKDWKRTQKKNNKTFESKLIDSRKNTFAFKSRLLSNDVKNITEEQVNNFIDYWTEKNTSGRLMRFEMQKTFEIKRRLAKWRDNNKEWKIKKKEKPMFKLMKSGLGYHAYCSRCGKKEMPSDSWALKRGSSCCAVEYSPTPNQ